MSLFLKNVCVFDLCSYFILFLAIRNKLERKLFLSYLEMRFTIRVLPANLASRFEILGKLF